MAQNAMTTEEAGRLRDGHPRPLLCDQVVKVPAQACGVPSHLDGPLAPVLELDAPPDELRRVDIRDRRLGRWGLLRLLAYEARADVSGRAAGRGDGLGSAARREPVGGVGEGTIYYLICHNVENSI